MQPDEGENRKREAKGNAKKRENHRTANVSLTPAHHGRKKKKKGPRKTSVTCEYPRNSSPPRSLFKTNMGAGKIFQFTALPRHLTVEVQAEAQVGQSVQVPVV